MRRRVLVSLALMGLASSFPARGVTVSIDPVSLVEAARIGLPVSIEAAGLGRVALRLRPNRIHAPGAVFTETDARGVMRAVRPEPFWTLAGEVAGAPGSVVRLTVTKRWVSGFVAARGRTVWIEPDDYENPARIIMTEPSDAPASSLPGARDLVVEAPPTAAAAPGEDDVNVGVGNCLVVSCGRLTALITLDADKSFNDISPTTCFAREAAVLNSVSAIYAPVNVGFEIGQQNCRTSTAGLGPAGTAAEPYLANLRTTWNADSACGAETCPDRSLVFLFVGYDIPGGVIGVAYRPGVCTRLGPDPLVIIDWVQHCENGYALAQMVPSSGSNYTGTGTAFAALKAKLAAHEIGHSFNATHEAATGCDTAAPRNGDIMCGIIQEAGPSTFSAANAREIRDWAESTIGSVL